MLIKHIYIQGLWSFGMVHMPFHDHLNDNLTIIAGGNGTGKSNLFRCLSLLRSLANGTFQQFIAKSGGAEAVFHNGVGGQKKAMIGIKFRESAVSFKTYDYEIYLSSTGNRVQIDKEVIRDAHCIERCKLTSSNQSGNLESILFGNTEQLATSIREHFQGIHVVSKEPDIKECLTTLKKLKIENPTLHWQIINHLNSAMPTFKEFTGNEQSWRSTTGDIFPLQSVPDGAMKLLWLAIKCRPRDDLKLVAIDCPEMGISEHQFDWLINLFSNEKHGTLVITQSSALITRSKQEYLNVFKCTCGETIINAEHTRDYMLAMSSAL